MLPRPFQFTPLQVQLSRGTAVLRARSVSNLRYGSRMRGEEQETPSDQLDLSHESTRDRAVSSGRRGSALNVPRDDMLPDGNSEMAGGRRGSALGNLPAGMNPVAGGRRGSVGNLQAGVNPEMVGGRRGSLGNLQAGMNLEMMSARRGSSLVNVAAGELYPDGRRGSAFGINPEMLRW